MPVTAADGVLLGIVTNRDIRFETDHRRRVADVMTPMPLVTAPVGVPADDALRLLARHKVEKLPLVDAAPARPDHRQGFHQERKVPAGHEDARPAVVGAAVGVGEDAKRRARASPRSAPTSWWWTPRTATPRRSST